MARSPAFSSQGVTITYDAENRMKSWTVGTTSRELYDYDGEGRRVRHTHQTYNAGNWTTPADGVTTYVYDAAGQLAAEYYSAAQDGAPCGTCYLTADALGSTRLMTDASGNAVARYDYLPFGEEIPCSIGQRSTLLCGGISCLPSPATSASIVSQRFTGKERDAETGLDYFGARYMSSVQGRFVTPDWAAQPSTVPYASLSDPQTLNLYSYVRNNPESVADGDGHCPWCVGALLGAGFGAALETYSQYRAGEGFNVAKIGGSALQGLVVGTVAASTGGLSLFAQGTALATANVASGAVARATDLDDKTKALSASKIATEAVAGFAGGAAGGLVGNAIKAEVAAARVTLQVESNQAARVTMKGIVQGDAAASAAGRAVQQAASMQSKVFSAVESITPGAARAATKATVATATEAVIKGGKEFLDNNK